MFSSIMKVIPKLDQATLRKMEQTLTTRFTKIAKAFGKGIANSFKGAGIAGVALALIDKVLNPLKEVQESIERTLKSSDDIATNAKEFGTSSGKLFKLITLAKANGLDQDNLFTLIAKYQSAVAEARANPGMPSAVSNFTGETDTSEGFFKFIQSLKNMEESQKILVQNSVFGEKQRLKMADFLNGDFAKNYADTGLDKVTSDKLTGSINKLGDLNDLADTLEARRGVGDIQTKSRAINESMIRSRDQAERVALEKENKRLASYEDLSTISVNMEKIMGLVETGVAMIGKLITLAEPFVKKIIPFIEKVEKTPFLKGIINRLKGD